MGNSEGNAGCLLPAREAPLTQPDPQTPCPGPEQLPELAGERAQVTPEKA